MTIDQMTIDQMTISQMTIDQMTNGQIINRMGSQKLTGDNLKVIWAEFPTIS